MEEGKGRWREERGGGGRKGELERGKGSWREGRGGGGREGEGCETACVESAECAYFRKNEDNPIPPLPPASSFSLSLHGAPTYVCSYVGTYLEQFC